MSGYIGVQPVPQATQRREYFTATSGQTTFNTNGYTPGYIDVFMNGVKLSPSDFTATNGSDVVLASGATTGDLLQVISFTPFNVANQTFVGNVNLSSGAYQIGGNTVIDSSREITAKKFTLTDDGASGALAVIRADDGDPWGLVVGNDSVSSDDLGGLNIYQNSNSGNAEIWIRTPDRSGGFIFRTKGITSNTSSDDLLSLPAGVNDAATFYRRPQVNHSSPYIIINDTNATDTNNMVGWLSFQRQGSERGYVGYGSASNDQLYVDNYDGNIVLSAGSNSYAVNIASGNLQMGGTTVIDSSLDATFGTVNANLSGELIRLTNQYTPSGARWQLDAEGLADGQQFKIFWHNGTGYENRLAIGGGDDDFVQAYGDFIAPTGAFGGAVSNPNADQKLETRGAYVYTSGATSLATSATKAGVRFQGASDASTSLYFGGDTSAHQYIQVANYNGTGSANLRLQPWGGTTIIGGLTDIEGTLAVSTTSQNGIYLGDTPGDYDAYGTGVPTIDIRGTSSANRRAGAITFREQDGTLTGAIYSTYGGDGYAGLNFHSKTEAIKFAIGGSTSSPADDIVTMEGGSYKGRLNVNYVDGVAANGGIGGVYAYNGFIGANEVSASGSDNDSNVRVRVTINTSTSVWRAGYAWVYASSCGTGGEGPVTAWWFYRFRTYNSSIGAIAVMDSGGDTSSFSVSFSDDGDPDADGTSLVIGIRVASTHSTANDETVMGVRVGTREGPPRAAERISG